MIITNSTQTIAAAGIIQNRGPADVFVTDTTPTKLTDGFQIALGEFFEIPAAGWFISTTGTAEVAGA